MNIKQFRYGGDNFGYLLYGDTLALAIDPGAVDDMVAFAKEHHIKIRWVANTHAHPDHTVGNSEMIKRTSADYLDNKELRQQKRIDIEGHSVQILHTPGHTMDSICFWASDTIVTGDTLFNGTVGNCFSGDLVSFYHSIKMLMQLPKTTRVFAGHDYIREAMIFAREVEPSNPYIDEFLNKYQQDCLYSTIDDELRVNPFLRFNEPEIIAFLKNIGRSTETEYDRWYAIMQIG